MIFLATYVNVIWFFYPVPSVDCAKINDVGHVLLDYSADSYDKEVVIIKKMLGQNNTTGNQNFYPTIKLFN